MLRVMGDGWRQAGCKDCSFLRSWALRTPWLLPSLLSSAVASYWWLSEVTRSLLFLQSKAAPSISLPLSTLAWAVASIRELLLYAAAITRVKSCTSSSSKRPNVKSYLIVEFTFYPHSFHKHQSTIPDPQSQIHSDQQQKLYPISSRITSTTAISREQDLVAVLVIILVAIPRLRFPSQFSLWSSLRISLYASLYASLMLVYIFTPGEWSGYVLALRVLW